jgi:DNA-binding Xre family transcriptional regulator
MQDRIKENMKTYFPLITEHTVEFIPDDRTSMVMRLDTGESFLYDDYDKTIRRLPSDSGSMTELEFRREFCFRVRKIMMVKGITQSELSDITGITQPALSNYLSCKTTPGFYAVDKIAKALKCSVDDFRYTK